MIWNRLWDTDRDLTNLARNPSGRYVFRLRVPIKLQAVIGRVVIKHALGTTHALDAQRQTREPACRYAQLFEQIGSRRMPKRPTPDVVLAGAGAHGLSRYELDLQSDRLKVDGSEDHALAMDALARLAGEIAVAVVAMACSDCGFVRMHSVDEVIQTRCPT